MAIPTIYANIKQGMTSGGEEDLKTFERCLISGAGGVVDKDADHFEVQAESPASTTIVIKAGEAFVRADYTDDLSEIMHLKMASDGTLTASANSSGNTRIDAVVLYWDTDKVPNATASDIATIVIVAGTPAGSPVAPTDSDIQTAIGADKGWIRLANITLENGFSSIVDDDITDTREIAIIKQKNAPTYWPRTVTVSDFTYNDAEFGYTTLDLSSIVPANTVAVHLRLVISDNTVGSYIEARPVNASTSSSGFAAKVQNTAENNLAMGTIAMNNDLSVGQSISIRLDDKGGTAAQIGTITVLGYYTK